MATENVELLMISLETVTAERPLFLSVNERARVWPRLADGKFRLEGEAERNPLPKRACAIAEPDNDAENMPMEAQTNTNPLRRWGKTMHTVLTSELRK